MKNPLILLILTVTFFSSCKKDKVEPQPTNPTTPTYYTFEGMIGTNDNSTVVTNDNNLTVCGNSNNNICLLKISKTGNQIWRKDFTAGNNTSASALVETSNQDLLIVGRTSRNYATSSWDVLLVKTNSAGDTLWTKTYGSNKEDYGYQIIKTNDSNYLISAITYADSTSGFCDIYLLKVNSDGDTLWTKSYKDQDQEIPFHVIQTQNGEYLVTGTNEDNSQPRGLYFLKVDASGNKLWDKTIGAATWRWGYSTLELSSGDLLTCGHHTSNGHSQVLLVKTDNAGNEYWEKEFGDANLSEESNSIKPNSDGTFTITGSSYDVTTTQDDIILLKVDQNGNQVWYKKFGGAASEWGVNLIKDSNGDNIITGTTYSYGTNASSGNIFMTKTDDSGNFK